MDSGFQCGSPTGMEQLIKYFESQSRRLNRQAPRSTLSSLNTEFMSAIKFKGVPILPPALTSSRRDELRQLKKDAVLLEKRLKARHRQELLAKADSLINKSEVYFPETSPKQGARKLNFDSGGQGEYGKVSSMQSGIGICSTLSRADTGTDLEDFGLQTMDSVSSDFMSLDSDCIPRVFSGLTLTSVKEQKISYDLDRLSKALNVQDLASTSSSDLSDVLDFNNIQDVKKPESAKVLDPKSTHNLHDKFVPPVTKHEHDGESTSAFHQSHNKVSPEFRKKSIGSTGSSGVIENTNTTNLDQTKTSANSSPGCGSAKSSTVTEGQWSNRSSPKSQRSGVHFSSFVTEYINTGGTQALEKSTVIKRKISSDEIHPSSEVKDDKVLPIIGGPRDYRKRSHLICKGSDCQSDVGLEETVPFIPDVELSLPPFDKNSHVPFQGYGRSDKHSSDKENDASQLHRNFSQGYKRSSEPSSKSKNNGGEQRSTETTASEKSEHKIVGEKINDISTVRGGMEDKAIKKILPVHSSPLQSDSPSVIKRMEGFQYVSSPSLGSSHTTALADSNFSLLKSGKAGNKSVSDSHCSNKSSTLTNASESSCTTVRQDFTPIGSIADTNIFVTILPSVSMKSDQRQERQDIGNKNGDKEENHKLRITNSPKKLNTEENIKEVENKDKCVTPKQTNICRNSYTLSEPSPALVQAQGRPKTEKNEVNHEQNTTAADNTMLTERQHDVGDQLASSERVIPAFVKDTVTTERTMTMSMTLGAETEGKAEHINKYLSQVQFQNSVSFTGQSWGVQHASVEEGVENMEGPYEDEHLLPGGNMDDEFRSSSVLDVLRSVAESLGSLEQLTIEELLELHQQQMNEKRQALIRQQQKDMEELFVQQRREVMLLEAEIKAAQQMEKEQQKFLVQNAPENIKVKSRGQESEYSPVQTGTFENNYAKFVHKKSSAETLLNAPQLQSSQALPSSNPLSVTNFKLQTKNYSWLDTKLNKPEQRKSKPQGHHKKSSINRKSPDDSDQDNQIFIKTNTKDNVHSRSVSSIDDMGTSNRIPEFSTSVLSPHLHHSAVMWSPLKYPSFHNRADRVLVPPEAYMPEMKVKFDKVTAAAKGFLTRLLLKSDKVQELKKTVRDTREFAFSFQTETPIKKGTFTSQDKVLLERLVAQLQAAVLDIHEIFFDIPVSEQMALIEQTRLNEQEKRVKSASRDSTRESGPKISQATMKALERKRKSREAEASGVSASRSRTAPPRTSSPQHINPTESRALKPLPGHSQISPIKHDTNRQEKGCPDSVKEKPGAQPKRIIAQPNKSASVLIRANSDSQKKGSLKLSVVTLKPVVKAKHEANKQLSRPSKSWR